MRIAVTGASGFLGQNLLKTISNLYDWEVVATDLRHATVIDDYCDSFVQADINDAERLKEVFDGVDAVVHCASAAPSHAKSVIDRVNIQGAQAVASAIRSSGVGRLVHISSTAVYGIPDHCPMTEDTPLQPFHDPYNISKIRAEEIFDTLRDDGTTVTILRPRTFTGPGRLGTFAILADWASSGKNFPVLGSGRNQYQFLDIDDLCSAVMLAINADASKANAVFNIGADEYGTIAGDYQAVLDRAGHGKRIIGLPAKPIEIILQVLELTRLSPLYGRLYRKISMDYFVSNQKAKDKLGYSPQFSNAESLVRMYDWYVANKAGLGAASGKNNNEIWQQGLLKVGKIVF